MVRPGPSLFVRIDTPAGRLEHALMEFVSPLFRELRSFPELEGLFFARYQWQILLRILGPVEWVGTFVGDLLEPSISSARERGLVLGHAFEDYLAETERYGGAEGVRLAERIFQHDSVACLDLIAADTSGQLAKSRREFSLVLIERFLDLLRFDRERRIDFYRVGYAWAIEEGSWREEDLRLLEARFQSLRDGLTELFRGARQLEAESVWGGAAPAGIAHVFLDSTRPVAEELIEAHRSGRIDQDLVQLAWSIAHMHCVRLGVDSNAEAILRFFMHRLHQEEEVVAA